ncbi:SPOR domain-containing protein [Halomonas nitroreducens]|uniref:SPOR domain-containing protein n=1 Tax=Halomonas nitroreducens TaxID=447425 RepID=A0A431V3W3_9GAMM|nr:SPOR domain-containing protein [Halomonas nitroreducens]RTR03440.1 SPOR domain-containing protein [Halomonas nitroreducens]
MASRKPPANRKRGATSSKRRPAKPQRRGLPGWLWGLAGMVAGFLISQHQHGTAPWQDGPVSPLATVVPKPPASADGTSGGEDPPAPDEPRMPTFEFYTLLPESEVIAPGGQVPDSTATPPPRPPEAETDEEQARPAAAADDPIAQVIAANSAPAESTAEPASPPDAGDGKRYVLQAASFRASGDARRLASRLQDFGLLAKISEVQTGDGATWHRVQVGPYSDRRELNRAQDLMVTQGIEPLLIQLQ